MQGLGLSRVFTFNFHRVKLKIIAKSRETLLGMLLSAPHRLRTSSENSDSREQARNETSGSPWLFGCVRGLSVSVRWPGPFAPLELRLHKVQSSRDRRRSAPA